MLPVQGGPVPGIRADYINEPGISYFSPRFVNNVVRFIHTTFETLNL